MHKPRTPCVVIAEDDDEMRSLLRDLVSQLEVNVDLAASGGELVVRLAEDRPVDLLVTDLRMPWLTGFQAALSARRAGLSMPIIMVTAFPDNELRAKVSLLGAAMVLEKPFRPEELVSLVRSQLSSLAASA